MLGPSCPDLIHIRESGKVTDTVGQSLESTVSLVRPERRKRVLAPLATRQDVLPLIAWQPDPGSTEHQEQAVACAVLTTCPEMLPRAEGT
jgi:hypothetical protein